MNHIDSLAIIPGEVRSQGNTGGVSKSDPNWDDFGQWIVDKVDNALSGGNVELHPSLMHDIKIRILATLPGEMRSSLLIDSMRKKTEAFNLAHERVTRT